MLKNCRTAPAPSSEATSYSSRGTFFRAARKMTIVPLTPHRVISTIDGFTQAGSISHCGPSIPKSPRTLVDGSGVAVQQQEEDRGRGDGRRHLRQVVERAERAGTAADPVQQQREDSAKQISSGTAMTA